MTDLYSGYEDWKGWDETTFMTLAPVERAYFDREVGPYPLHGRNVLDIGFGNGTFLAWSREKGAIAHGTELSRQGVRLAQSRDVTVLPLSLADLGPEFDGRFALITAFDVLEHLTPAEIEALLGQVARLLGPMGRFLARFPNGQSPFGRINQASDYTHVTTVSPAMIVQLARGKPLKLITVGEDLQVVFGGRLTRIKQRIQIRIREKAAAMLKWIFRFDAPMGVNVTITLERA